MSKIRWSGLPVCFAALLACAAPAAAQMTCKASGEPRSLRHFGAAELLADLVIECTGGRQPAPGEETPKYQVVVSADAPLTMRTLSENDTQSIQWTEALLLIDEPAPRNQYPCVPTAEDAEEDPESTDCGVNAGRANVFQGLRLQRNAVVFRDTPIAPPGASGKRTLRVVNLRADVRSLTPKPKPEPEPEDIAGAPPQPEDPAEPAEVYLTVRIFGPGGEIVPVDVADQLAGVLAPDVKFSVRTHSDQEVPKAEPVLLSTPAMTPQGRPEDGPMFLVKFTELSSAVFRRRNAGTNGDNPAFITSQANPGIRIHTESGFFNGAYPNTRGLNKAGLADSGTRIRVVADGVPPGIRVWFSFRDVETGTTNYDPNVPKARLTAPEGGVFRPQLPETGDYVEVWPSNGHAEALWEITSSDPNVLESLAFEVGLTGPNRDVELGDAVIYGDIAPAMQLGVEDPDLPDLALIPAFDTSPKIIEPRPAFSIVPVLETKELTSVSAAGYKTGPVAPGSIVAAFGEGLAAAARQAFGAPRPVLGTTRVDVIDSAGGLRQGLIFAVSPGQVNFYLDPATRGGPAVVTVYNGARPVAEGLLQVADVAPGLFSANGDGAGAPAGQVVTSSPQGQTASLLAQLDRGGRFEPKEIDLSVPGSQSFIVLYGTGIRRRASLGAVSVTVNGISIPVLYAGDQKEFLGLDQINAGPLPKELIGRGEVSVEVRVGAAAANPLRLKFR